MRRIWIIFILLQAFILVGCDKKNKIKEEKIDYSSYKYSYILTKDNFDDFFDLSSTDNNTSVGYDFKITLAPKEGVVPKGVTVKINYRLKYKLNIVQDSYKTHYLIFQTSRIKPVDVSIVESNRSFTLAQIVSYEIESINGTIYTNTKHEVKIQKDQPLDQEINKKNYDIFMKDMEELDPRLNSNFFNIQGFVNTKVYTDKGLARVAEESATMKVRVEPFYFETISNYEHNVLEFIDGKLLNYRIPTTKTDNRYWIERSVINQTIDVNQYFKLEEVLSTYNTNLEFDFDFEKVKVDIRENQYIISGYFKDLIPIEIFEIFKEGFTELDLSSTPFDFTRVELIIEVTDEELIIITNLLIPLKYQKIERVDISTKIIINFKEFDVIDFYDESLYYMKLPNSFENIIESTDPLNEVISIEPYNKHYYFVHLEKGVYEFEKFGYPIYLELYNEDYERVKLSPFFDLEFNNHQNIFSIETGNYYLKVSNSSKIGYKFLFNKLEYTDWLDFDNPSIINEGDFTFNLEGKYDLILCNYKSSTYGLLQVKSNDINSSMAYYYDIQSGKLLNNVFGYEFYSIKPGDNFFYIHGSDGEYSYSVNFFEVNDNKNKEDNEYLEVNTLSDWLVVGRGLPNSYYKLSLKRGIYDFRFQKFDESFFSPSFSFGNVGDSGYTNNVFFSNRIIIHDSSIEYFVTLDSHRGGIYKIEYSYEEFSDQIEEIELRTIANNKFINQGFPSYDGVSYTNTGEYKYGYKFTISEKSNVLIYLENHTYRLYDSDYRRMNFDHEPNRNDGILYTLDPDTYFIEVKTAYNRYTFYELRIAIITNEISDDYFYNLKNLNEVKLGENVFYRDYSNDIDIVKFIAKEESNYIFSYNNNNENISFTIYNENFEYFTYISKWDYREVTFPKGEYYFLISYEWPLTIGKFLFIPSN